MSRESEEILSGLQELEAIITEINSTSSSENHSLPLLNQQITKLRSKCSEKEISDIDLLGLQNDFSAIENSLAITFLNVTAIEEWLSNVPWHFTGDWITDNTLPLRAQIKSQLQNFKTAIQERNEICIQQLSECKEKLKAKANRDQITEIDNCVQKIKTDLTKLTVSQDEIDTLLKKPRPKKRLKKQQPIESATSSQEEKVQNEKTLRDLVEANYKKFRASAEENSRCTLAQSDLVALCQDDPIIIINLNLFREIEQKSRLLIESVNTFFDKNYVSIRTENHQSILDRVNDSLSQLSDLTNHKSKLKDFILARQQLLLPSQTSIRELETELDNNKKTLRNSLEHFLMIFSAINLTSDNDLDTNYFINDLKYFIKAIRDDLAASNMPLNNQGLSDFYVKLEEHLGEKLKWHGLEKEDKISLDTGLINQFLSNLFDIPAEENTLFAIAKTIFGGGSSKEETLKRQIIAVRGLSSRIDRFPIEAINQYNALKATQDDQKNIIDRKYDELQIQIVSLEQNLQNSLNLFSSEYKDYPEITNANIIRRSLETFNAKLASFFVEHKQKMVSLLAIKSPLQRLTEITNEQENTLAALVKMEEEFHSATGLNSTVTQSLQTLSHSYNLEKSKLINQLRLSISDTEAALKIHDEPEMVKSKIEAENKKVQALVNSPPLNLYQLRLKVATHLNLLNSNIRDIINRLNIEYSGVIGQLPIKLGNFVQPTLSDLNPFKTSLANQQQYAENAIVETWRVYQSLDNYKPTHLQDYIDMLDGTVDSANQAIDTRDTLLKKAGTIEERLISEEYLSSLTIIETLERQYLRLINKYITKALDEYPANKEELQTIQQNPDALLQLDSLSANQASFLNIIDPRLYKLWSVRKEFMQINSEYINIDLKFNDRATKRIIDNLTEEYLHIFNSHIDAAIVKNPELIRIKGNPNALLALGDVTEHQKISNLIDSRLSDLYLKIRQQQPQPTVSPGKFYVNLLLSTVETHLHNNKMEHFSDGKRSEFVQWIRLNILKPLQSLKYMVGSLLSGEDSKHRFFTTVGATKTEAQLVEKGNEIAGALITASARAA